MKKIASVLLCIGIVLTVSFPVMASTYNHTNTGNLAVVTISDPETGEEWKWDVPLQYKKTTTYSMDGEIIRAGVKIELGDYLLQTFDYEEKESAGTIKNSDIELFTGLTYSLNAENNSARVYSVDGYTKPVGDYYASNRIVSWRNPGAGLGYQFRPTTNEWSEETDSTAGFYSSDLPPYSLLDCEVHITGMTAYRNVSVLFEAR